MGDSIATLSIELKVEDEESNDVCVVDGRRLRGGSGLAVETKDGTVLIVGKDLRDNTSGGGCCCGGGGGASECLGVDGDIVDAVSESTTADGNRKARICSLTVCTKFDC